MNKGLTNEQQKEWAQLLFTKHDFTEKEIAIKVGVEEATVRKWIRDNNWEGVRRSLLTSKEYQLNILYDILSTLTTRIKEQEEGNTKDADLLIKYTAAIKNLEAETSVTQIIEVAKLFTLWLQTIDLELTKTVTLYFDSFIKERLNKAA